MQAARQLSRQFIRDFPADAGRVLEALSPSEAEALVAKLPPRLAASGLRSMTSSSAARVLSRLPDPVAGEIVAAMTPEAAAALLGHLGLDDRERILALAPSKTAATLRRRLRFPEDSAGHLADSRILTFPDQMSVSQALAQIRRSPPEVHYYLYVVDSEGRLVGVLNLRELMMAQPAQSLVSIMNSKVDRLPATARREGILVHPGWRRVHALPVVDGSDRLIGVLSHETRERLAEESGASRSTADSASFGLALADLCWIGMTRILGGVATTILPEPVVVDRTSGGVKNG